MPDEKPLSTNTSDPTPELPSDLDTSGLASLIDAAELEPPEQANSNKAINDAAERQLDEPTAPLPSNSAECSHDGTFPHQRTFCRQCKKLICPQCCSALDSLYCAACMSAIDLRSEDKIVTDDDGVAHTGKQITVTPAYNTIRWIPEGKTTAKALSDMDESELFEFIRQYKDAVREAERALDFRRIRLGSAQLELDERREQTRRKLRADKTKFNIKTVTVDKVTGKKVTQTKSVSTPQMMQMLQALQALKAMKTKPQQTQQKPQSQTPAEPKSEVQP